MQIELRGSLFLAVFLGFASAALPPLTGFYNGKPLRHLMDTIYGVNDVNCSAVVQQTNFTQIVDHFSASDNRTWNQRVLLNNAYSKEDIPSVVFLLIGGEGTSSIQSTCWSNYTYISLAAQHNALIIQLEHRFFGYSYPLWTKDGKADMSTEALKLLTSQQALADLANFITTFNQMEGGNPRWFRAQYPHLSVGGICSSAPLWAKVDFYEYAQVMEYAIGDYSPVCKEAIKNGFAIAREYVYSDDGRQTLNSIFNIDPPLDPKTSKDFELDATNFLATLFNSFQGIIQYTFDAQNNNTINGFGLTGLCENVLGDLNITNANGTVDLNYNRTLNANETAYLQLIADVYFWTIETEYHNPNRTLDNNYADALGDLTRTTYDVHSEYDREVSAGRGWMWLSCGMALGWLQTTEGGEGMFGRALPLNYYLNMCYELFGEPVNTTYITAKVAESVDHFKNPWNYTATNVVLPNGEYDPWSALGSYVTNKDAHQISVRIPAAAHCSDMYPSRDGEPAALNATRTLIANEVAYYLTQTPYVETTTHNSGNTHTLLSIAFAIVVSLDILFVL